MRDKIRKAICNDTCTAHDAAVERIMKVIAENSTVKSVEDIASEIRTLIFNWERDDNDERDFAFLIANYVRESRNA